MAARPCYEVGAGTFWFGAGAGIKARLRLPAPGSGSILDKTEEILNDILSVCFNIEKMLIKNNYSNEIELFLVRNMVPVSCL